MLIIISKTIISFSSNIKTSLKKIRTKGVKRKTTKVNSQRHGIETQT